MRRTGDFRTISAAESSSHTRDFGGGGGSVAAGVAGTFRSAISMYASSARSASASASAAALSAWCCTEEAAAMAGERKRPLGFLLKPRLGPASRSDCRSRARSSLRAILAASDESTVAVERALLLNWDGARPTASRRIGRVGQLARAADARLPPPGAISIACVGHEGAVAAWFYPQNRPRDQLS